MKTIRKELEPDTGTPEEVIEDELTEEKEVDLGYDTGDKILQIGASGTLGLIGATGASYDPAASVGAIGVGAIFYDIYRGKEESYIRNPSRTTSQIKDRISSIYER